ncbi:MAG: hypothetical protein ACRD0K_10135 [Egibacteraceae bacterium]
MYPKERMGTFGLAPAAVLSIASSLTGLLGGLFKPSSTDIAKKLGPGLLAQAQAGDLYAVYILEDQSWYAATTETKAVWKGFYNQVPAGVLAEFWRHPLAGSRRAGIPIAGTTVYASTEATFRAATPGPVTAPITTAPAAPGAPPVGAAPAPGGGLAALIPLALGALFLLRRR